MNPYALEAIVDQKIAEDREWAARYRFIAEAQRARRETGQPAGSPLAGLLRTFASALRFSQPVQPTTAQEPQAE